MEDFKVNHSGNTYNIKEFLRNHPGGLNYMEPYKNKKVTERMESTNHSKSAFYLLRDYKVDGRDVVSDKFTDDLEKYVDWSKPMLAQVASLGKMYGEWVNSPVDRKMRLFGNPVLEFLTITPWYMVPIIWIPVSLYFIFKGTQQYMMSPHSAYSFISIPTFILFGVLMWTLVEYSLHRWVFHSEPTGKSKIHIYIHFTLHGLHHKVPFDSRRLVFPPFPAAMVVYLGYSIYRSVLPSYVFEIVIGGTVLGYVTYDMIHFYVHHGNPAEGSYLYNLKRYHNQHHFAHHEAGFGISSKIWDVFFGTLIKLRDLSMGIRWQ